MPPQYPIPLRIREYKLTDKGVEVAVLMSNFSESKFDLSELATIDSGLVQEFLWRNPVADEHYKKNKSKQSNKK